MYLKKQQIYQRKKVFQRSNLRSKIDNGIIKYIKNTFCVWWQKTEQFMNTLLNFK